MAARRADYVPLAIDLYGDQDTLNLAGDFQQISMLAEEHVMPAIKSFAARYPLIGVVYGSGFEQHAESLKAISKVMTLFGNGGEVFDRLSDKPRFFSTLKNLGIACPEVCFYPPILGEGWLIKPTQGQGGFGIREYRPELIESSPHYWQKYQAGEAHSVLFLANGEDYEIVGFNTQWTTAINTGETFVFSGIINHAELTESQKLNIAGWLAKLVREYSLKGLNSLDFIQSGEASYVLEVNPRPPASTQLYDADLFFRHIRACQGELLGVRPKQVGFSGIQIVYAPRNLLIPNSFQWPQNTLDLPMANAIVHTGQPICSMISHAQDPQTLRRQLQKQHDFIINALDRLPTHGL